MEDPRSSSSEVESDSETERSDPESDDSDLYGDLESSPSQKWPQNIPVSGDTDVDDSDIFLELGMPASHGSQVSEEEVAHSLAVSSETNTKSVNDDIKNKINENDCKGNSIVPETKVGERQNVGINVQKDGYAVSSETNGSLQSHKECKDKMVLQDRDKGKYFANTIARAAVTTQQVGPGEKVNPRSFCDVEERLDLPTSTNKDVQFILSCLSRQRGMFLGKSLEMNVNTCMPKRNGDCSLNRSDPSASDIDELSTSKSIGYVSEYRMLTDNLGRANETVTDSKDVLKVKSRVSSQANSIGGEATNLTNAKRVCASDFMTKGQSDESLESGSAKPTKRTRKKSEPKRKASSQMDLFEDFLVGRDREELAQKVAELKLEKETLQKQLEESQNRCIDLESDNETLLSNMSALWKTSMSQLRKKCSELALLKREKEEIIFRRAMRQVPRDELDLIISRIAAYNRDEFCTFMKNLKKEEKECACGNVASASVEKQSLTQRIKLSIRGTRVHSSADIEAHTLQIMLGKQGERVTFSAEEVHKKIKSSTKEKNHANIENQTSSLNYEKHLGQHTLAESSRYTQKSNSMSCDRFSQGSLQKNINTKFTCTEHVEKSKRRSVFSRLGVRKSFGTPDEKPSVCDVRDVLREKQNRKPGRPDETEDIPLNNSQVLVSSSTKHTPIYYREPKDNTDEVLNKINVCIGNGVECDSEEKHLQYPLHREEKSLNSASAEVETDHITNTENVVCGASQKSGAKSPRPESPELHNEQCEIRRRGKKSSIALKAHFDTSDQEDEMLTKSLYGQRMLAKLKNLSKSQAQPQLQPVVSNSLHSAVDSGSKPDCCNSSQPQDFGGEIDCNMRTVMLSNNQKVDQEINSVDKKSRVSRGSTKKVTHDESKTTDQKEDEFKTNHLLESLTNEKLVFCPSHSNMEEGRRKELLLYDDRSQHTGYHRKEKEKDGSTETKKDSRMCLVIDASKKHSFVEKDFIGEEVGERSTEVYEENSKEIRLKEVNDTLLCMISEDSARTDVNKQGKESSNTKRGSCKESDIERKIAETSKLEEGNNRIVKVKKKRKISEVSKCSTETSTMTKNLKTLNEVDKQVSKPEGIMSDATLGRRSDRNLNVEKGSAKKRDGDTLIEAESDKTSNKDEGNQQSSKTEVSSNSIPDTDKKSSSELKREEKTDGDSNLSKDGIISKAKNEEIKSKAKSRKLEVKDRKAKKLDEDKQRNKQSEEGKVRNRKHKQGDLKSKEEGRKDDISKNSERSDFKSKQEDRQDSKTKEKERSDLKSTEEEIRNLNSKEENRSDLKSKEEEFDVKSREEERKDVKSKEKEKSDVEPKQDRISCVRSKKGGKCKKLRETEKKLGKSRQDKRKIDTSKGDRKDVKSKQKEIKVGEPFEEVVRDDESNQVELKVNSKQEISKVREDLTSKQEESEKTSKEKLRDVDTKDKEIERKPKENEQKDLKSKSKEKVERLKQNIGFVLDEEMHGRNGKTLEDGDEGHMQNDTIYSEDYSATQDSREHLCVVDNVSVSKEELRGDSEAFVISGQELCGDNVALKEYNRNINKGKCRETTLCRSFMSRKGSKEDTVEGARREAVFPSTQSIEEEIQLRDCKAGGDHDSDIIDILNTESDIDKENSSSEDESKEFNNERYQGKKVYETLGNCNVSDGLLQPTCREEERKGEYPHQVEEHDSETDEDHNELQKCVFQVSEMQEKEYVNDSNHSNHSENIQGKEENHKANEDYIHIHSIEKVMKETDSVKEVKSIEETGGNKMNYLEHWENKKDSMQNLEYIEESIFPQEEELLYDEGTDDSDEDESSQDLHEPVAKPVSEVFRVSTVEGVLFGSQDGIAKVDAFHSGKKHDHEENDMNLKNDLSSKKVNLKTLRGCRASEQISKEEGKRKSVHDRLWHKEKGENDGKRITSPVRTSARKENKNDNSEKTLRTRQRNPSLKNEEEKLNDPRTTNNRSWPRSLSPQRNDVRSGESRSRSSSRSPKKERQSERLSGRIRKLPQNINCKHLERIEESQSPLMNREKRLQVKKSTLQEPPHTRDNCSLNTRSSRLQKKRTEKPEVSPLTLLSQRTERNFVSQCKHSISPPRTREARSQTRKNEQQTEPAVQRKQGGSSPRNNDERIPLKRKERQEDWEESQSKRRRVSVKSRLSRPNGSDEENNVYVESRRYPSSPPELERRRSSRLRNLSGERRHRDDSFSDFPEKRNCSREKRKALGSNDVVGPQHDVKETMKNSSAKNIRVDSKLLQSVLAQSPSKFSIEEEEKEEGELDDDDADEDVQTFIMNKPVEGHTKKHALNKEEELKHHNAAEEKVKVYQSETNWKHSTHRENETNQDCLSEVRSHQCLNLKKEQQFTRASKIASKNRKDYNINEQEMASGVNLTHVIDEETDNFLRNRECRMKIGGDSSKVMKNDGKHRAESRNLGSLMEDTTFYPTDLFQVVQLQGDTDRINISSVTGPSSGSDDTIDMIVKRHNEKYITDNMNSSDDSEMSLLQFIADESEENSDNGKNVRRKNNSVTQQTAVGNVNENILSSRDSTPRELCDKENVEMGTKTGKTKVMHRKTGDKIGKLQVTSPRKTRNSSALLSNKTSTTFNVKERDDTYPPEVGIQSSNSRSTQVLNSVHSVDQDNLNSLEVSGNEGEIELDESPNSKSPNSVLSYCGVKVRERQSLKYDKCEKESDLNSLFSDTENGDKDGVDYIDCNIYSTNEGGDIDFRLNENENESERYYPNEHEVGTQGEDALISPISPEELLHQEENTKPVAATEADDDAASSSSSDSDSDSDCQCSKCVSSSSSCSSSSSSGCSSSSGSDSDAENYVTDLHTGTNLHLETLQEQNVTDTLTPMKLMEECDDSRNRSPSLLHDTSLNKDSCELSVRVSQKPKPLQSSPRTPKKLPLKDKKAQNTSTKMPVKSPHKVCKTPCKKTSHKTPCKKTPRKIPCKKSPHKTPCKKTPHKTLNRKTGKTPHKSPKPSSTETNLDSSQKAVPNIASGNSDVSLSVVVQDKTLKGKEKLSSVKVNNAEIVPECNSLACNNVNKEIRPLSPTGNNVLENLIGSQNESIGTGVIKSCDKTSEEQCTPASISISPTPVTVIQNRRRRTANFGSSGTSQVKLSCVNVSTVISVVHNNEDSKPVSSEKILKKSTSRSPRKASLVASQTSLATPVKEKQVYTPKRQLSPVSCLTEKENALGRKMRVLSPEMFGKVKNRLLFPDVDGGKEITGKDVGKPVDQPSVSGSLVTSPSKPSASNSLVVPVRIRRAKRHLNLGFSGSSAQNLVMVTSPDLLKNSKSSPQKNKFCATKTTPKTDSSMKVVNTVVCRSTRKSPRKLLKYS